MARHTRYQGAIVRDHHLLLIRHQRQGTGQTYWVFPGGGIEGDESAEACVVREMKEETHLDVAVERLLFMEREHPEGGYTWRRTYLCRLLGGRAAPGYEPEVEATDYVISEVQWFDLRNKDRWPVDLLQDAITYPQVLQVRRALGYLF